MATPSTSLILYMISCRKSPIVTYSIFRAFYTLPSDGSVDVYKIDRKIHYRRVPKLSNTKSVRPVHQRWTGLTLLVLLHFGTVGYGKAFGFDTNVYDWLSKIA